jgi:hypothetical protein
MMATSMDSPHGRIDSATRQFFGDWLGVGPWLKGLGHYTMVV